MSKHTIERIEPSLLTMTKDIASAFGKGVSKKLVVTFNQGSYVFLLTNGEEEIYKGTSSAKAVDMYNDIKGRSKPHTIEHFEVSDLEFSQQIGSSFGRGNNKELNLKVENCLFTYEVKNKGEVSYNGISSMKAVDVYNES